MDQILIVDDQSLFRQAMCLGLHAARLTSVLQPLEAENGKEALELIRENPNIRFIVTDVYMPVMDGIEFVRQFRQEFPERFRACQIFIVTTEGSVKLRQDMREVGVNAWLVKPVDPSKFFKALRIKFLGKQRR